MFHKILVLLLSVFLVLQTIMMLIASYTQLPYIQTALIIEAIFLLIFAFSLFPRYWLVSIVFIITGSSILLVNQFAIIKQYYIFITFLPLVGSIFTFLFGSKKKKQPKQAD